jgi:hypothetical protein
VNAGADVFQIQQLIEGADQRIAKHGLLLLEFFNSKEQQSGIGKCSAR